MNSLTKEILLKELLKLININVNKIEQCIGTIIKYETLRTPEIIEKYNELIPKLKEVYKSSSLNCLHNNKNSKQKFPAVNTLRQILKCNNLQLQPKILCKGYNKTNGKKIIERYYIINQVNSKEENLVDSKEENQDKEINQYDILNNVVNETVNELINKVSNELQYD